MSRATIHSKIMPTSAAEVLETTRKTLGQYEAASQTSGLDAHALKRLLTLSTPLQSVQGLLETITDDDDEAVLHRLDDIVVGDLALQVTLLKSLDTDMRTIYLSLQSAVQSGTPLTKADVDVYAESLKRYGQILKTARKRNME
jgi:hypothetical protein